MNAILRRPAQPQRLDEWAPSLLKAQLYGRLLLDIIIGVLPPGETLDENILARRYDGGLAGIRDALARLALEGLVVRKARVGTTVAPLDLVEARDAFEARRLVEIHCAGLAAAQGSDGLQLPSAASVRGSHGPGLAADPPRGDEEAAAAPPPRGCTAEFRPRFSSAAALRQAFLREHNNAVAAGS